MKKIVALVIFLAVVILGGYYVTGQIAENTIKRDVQAFNRVQGLHVEVKEYHRGFFKSHAVFAWKLHLPQHMQNKGNAIPSTDIQSELPLTIHHGPIMMSNQGLQIGLASASAEFGLPEPYASQFQQTFTPDSVKPKLDLNFVISFLLKTRVNVAIPQFKATAKNDNTVFNWQGFLAQTTSNNDHDNVQGDITLNGLQVGNDKKSLEVGKLSIIYNVNRNDMGLYLGNASSDIDSIAAKDGSNTLFELKQLHIASNNQIENKLFSVTLNGTLDKVIGNGKSFGPAKMTVNLSNLDAEALVRIRDIANNASQMGSAIQKNQALLGILPELPKLLSHGPRFEIPDMKVETPDGTLEGNVMVSLPENSGSNVFEMVQKVQGNAHISMPDALLRLVLRPDIIRDMSVQQQAQPQGTQPQITDLNAEIQTRLNSKIQKMLQSGLLMQKDKTYTIDLSLDKGQFTVNGKKFEPAMLQ